MLFNTENTEGFTADAIAMLNTAAAEILDSPDNAGTEGVDPKSVADALTNEYWPGITLDALVRAAAERLS